MSTPKRRPNGATSPEGRFAYSGLDRVFHEKARLGIMTSLLARPEGLTFPDLKLLCDLSDGNLNRHLAVLQETGFVEVEKEGAGRSSRTVCHLTRLGQRAFADYLDELERVIADAAAARKNVPQPAKSLRPGWSAS